MVAVPSSAPVPGTDVLAAMVAARREAEAAERRVLRLAVDYAHAHRAPGVVEPGPLGHEEMVELAGAGAPGVAEFAIADVAAALGLSTVAARRLVGQGLELAHRLPRLWKRLCDEPDPLAEPGRAGVAAWRARAVAEQTVFLSETGAAYVDAQVAPIIDKVGPTRLARIVAAAKVVSEEPETDELVEQAAVHDVSVVVDTTSAAHLGTAYVDAHLDAADGLDLEAAIQAAAARLKSDGSIDALGMRRAQALGLIARHYLATHSDRADRAGGVQLVVHYRPGSDADQMGVAELTNTGGLVTLDQIAGWCRREGARVTITKVIDLAEDLTAGGYVPSPYLRTQVQQRDKTCVFPHCTHPARSADLDHTRTYDHSPAAPPGQTRSGNLAALCRFHHRLKTHGEWSYEHLAPGWYLWRSGDGRRYLRGPTGAVDLT